MDNRNAKIGLLLLALIVSPSAHATGHDVTITVGEPPNQCTVRIIAVGPYHHGATPSGAADHDTEQSRADVATVRADLERALDQSQDMNDKVLGACNQYENSIDIMVFRDSTVLNFANANSGAGTIRVDLGDFADIQLSSPKQEAIDTILSADLTRTLAHEFDHLLDGPAGNQHKDPTGEEAGLTTGPAVDDENLVIAQMNETFPFHERRFYSVVSDGNPATSYWVDTDGDGEGDTSVLWFDARPSEVTGSSSSHILSEDELNMIGSPGAFICTTQGVQSGAGPACAQK